jgi:hypothetical protein
MKLSLRSLLKILDFPFDSSKSLDFPPHKIVKTHGNGDSTPINKTPKRHQAKVSGISAGHFLIGGNVDYLLE